MFKKNETHNSPKMGNTRPEGIFFLTTHTLIFHKAWSVGTFLAVQEKGNNWLRCFSV